MVVSTTTEAFLEEVAAASTGPKWWQLYMFTDRGITAEMLRRVVATGFRAIVMTVDFQDAGLRHRDTRHGFIMPIGLSSSELTYDFRHLLGRPAMASANRPPASPAAEGHPHR
jgi:isopentenyl diphosphate isomerase/L-lactate dehydrogenase-like FMN-dependent dehydrogenase